MVRTQLTSHLWLLGHCGFVARSLEVGRLVFWNGDRISLVSGGWWGWLMDCASLQEESVLEEPKGLRVLRQMTRRSWPSIQSSTAAAAAAKVMEPSPGKFPEPDCAGAKPRKQILGSMANQTLFWPRLVSTELGTCCPRWTRDLPFLFSSAVYFTSWFMSFFRVFEEIFS